VALTAGTTYFIVVDGSANGTGPYSLGIKKQKSFANPVQLDVSALLIHDTIVNNGAGALDATQDGIDFNRNNMVTQSAANQIRPGSTNYGLPDNATFAADGNHPVLHLGWDNANDGPNSRIMKPGDASFTIPVPADTYTQFQVYAISSEGTSSMQFTLNYSDGTTDTRTVSFADWFNNAATGTFYVIDGLDRITSTMTYEASHNPAMVGANLTPNAAKTLTSVAVNHQTSNGWFVFYGAAGW
jgi:hypothetical protein